MSSGSSGGGGSVRDRDRGARRLEQRLKQAQTDVEVGRIQVGIHRDDGAIIVNEESGLTLAGLAAIHEFGAPEAGIPARAWLRKVIDAAGPELQRAVATGMQRTLRSAARAPQVLPKVADDIITRKIKAAFGELKPLDPETIEDKGSAAVLQDTGLFVSKIDARWTWTRRGGPGKKGTPGGPPPGPGEDRAREDA